MCSTGCDTVDDAVSGAVDFVTDAGKSAVDAVGDLVEDVGGAIIDIGEAAIDLAVDAAEAVWDLGEDIYNVAEDIVNEAIDIFGEVIQWHIDFIIELHEFLIELGADILEEIFSWLGITDEEVYVVDYSTQQLITDETIENNGSLVVNAVRNAVLYGSDIVDEFMLAVNAGAYRSFTKLYNYAKSNYIYTLPDVYLSNSNENVDSLAVQDAIETHLGDTVNIVAVKDKYLLETEQIFAYLSDTYGNFNEHTKYVIIDGLTYKYEGHSYNGAGNYVLDLVHPYTTTTYRMIKTTYATTGGTTTITHREITVQFRDEDNYEITRWESSYVWYGESFSSGGEYDGDYYEVLKNLGTNAYPITYALTVPARDAAASSLVVWYKLSDIIHGAITDFLQSWTYDRSDGTYPALDTVPNNFVGSGSSYLPIFPIRKNNVSILNDESSAWFKTTNTALNYIGLNVSDIARSMDDNPETDNVRDAAVFFGMNIFDENEAMIRMLVNYFYNLASIQEIDKDTYNSWYKYNYESNGPVNVISIQEHNINFQLRFNYIDVQIKTGTIGALRKAKSSVHIKPATAKTNRTDDGGVYSYDSFGGEPRSFMRYKYQYSDTEYLQIEVHGLIMTTASYQTDGNVKVTITQMAEDEDTKKKFVLPLPYGMMDIMGADDREEIVMRSCHLIFYAAEQYHLEWYQTSAFANLLEGIGWVITIVITVFSFGTATSAWEAVKMMALRMLYQYAATMVVMELLSHNLSDAERAVVLAAYAAFSYWNMSGGGGQVWTMNAENLLLAVNAVNQAFTLDQAAKWQKLLDQQQEFENLSKTREEEIQEKLDLLQASDPMEFAEIKRYLYFDPYETPSAFYDRVCHATNPGVASLAYANDYVTNSLLLPQLT